ncbi:hypothetical protein GCM10008995_01570 [Halobellus salinus]|uniref:Restriction endonuclease n=1 Tax=Halobellus salinus TaxID=931585 RepID=A0A830E5S6_9EURY|nr:restriction endonuclease [Halobellus salinus]GGI95097.1 hypothetical protein GCM10008995_01570 [Halobellus salinus]
MGQYGDQYVVGEEYRNSTDLSTNEYRGWLNAPLDGGVSYRGIEALRNPQTDACELIVLYSSSTSSTSHDPWEDIINLEDGIAYYWGDSKAGDGPDPLSRRGNRLVKEQYCSTYAQNNRDEAPPVLLFQKERVGWVTFKGCCVIDDLSITRHRDEGETVVNYRIDLEILDTDTVDLEWIHRKSRTGYDVGGPDAWDHWVDTGTVRRYSIYNEQIRSKANQQPDTRLEPLHEDIRTRLDGTSKERGQKLEMLIERLLESMDNMTQVRRTPSSGDKGVDIIGQTNLLPDVTLGGNKTKLKFKAQVKNKKGSVGGRELSRLASRVGDGEIGLFFTMSHYTDAAQQESLSTYPIRLFAGGDIVDMLVQTDLTDGPRLNDQVVKEINNSV